MIIGANRVRYQAPQSVLVGSGTRANHLHCFLTKNLTKNSKWAIFLEKRLLENRLRNCFSSIHLEVENTFERERRRLIRPEKIPKHARWFLSSQKIAKITPLRLAGEEILTKMVLNQIRRWISSCRCFWIDKKDSIATENASVKVTKQNHRFLAPKTPKRL